MNTSELKTGRQTLAVLNEIYSKFETVAQILGDIDITFLKNFADNTEATKDRIIELEGIITRKLVAFQEDINKLENKVSLDKLDVENAKQRVEELNKLINEAYTESKLMNDKVSDTYTKFLASLEVQKSQNQDYKDDILHFENLSNEAKEDYKKFNDLKTQLEEISKLSEETIEEYAKLRFDLDTKLEKIDFAVETVEKTKDLSLEVLHENRGLKDEVIKALEYAKDLNQAIQIKYDDLLNAGEHISTLKDTIITTIKGLGDLTLANINEGKTDIKDISVQTLRIIEEAKKECEERANHFSKEIEDKVHIALFESNRLLQVVEDHARDMVALHDDMEGKYNGIIEIKDKLDTMQATLKQLNDAVDATNALAADMKQYEKMINDFIAQVAQLNADMDLKKQELETSITQLKDEIDVLGDAKKTALEASYTSAVTKLTVIHDKFNASAISAIKTLAGDLQVALKTLQSATIDYVRELEHHKDVILQETHDLNTDLNKLLDDKVKDVNVKLDVKVKEVNDKLDEKGKHLVDTVDQKITDLENLVDKSTIDYNNLVDTSNKAFDEKVTKANTDLDTKVAEAKASLDMKATLVGNEIDSKAMNATGEITAKHILAVSEITSKHEAVVIDFEDKKVLLENSIRDLRLELEKAILDKRAELTLLLKTDTDKLRAELEKLRDDTLKELEVKVKEIQDAVANANLNDIQDEMTKIKAVQAQTVAKFAKYDTDIAENTTKVTNALNLINTNLTTISDNKKGLDKNTADIALINASLTNLTNTDNDYKGRLEALENVDTAYNTRIEALENVDTAYNTRLEALENADKGISPEDLAKIEANTQAVAKNAEDIAKILKDGAGGISEADRKQINTNTKSMIVLSANAIKVHKKLIVLSGGGDKNFNLFSKITIKAFKKNYANINNFVIYADEEGKVPYSTLVLETIDANAGLAYFKQGRTIVKAFLEVLKPAKTFNTTTYSIVNCIRTPYSTKYQTNETLSSTDFTLEISFEKPIEIKGFSTVGAIYASHANSKPLEISFNDGKVYTGAPNLTSNSVVFQKITDDTKQP